MKKRIESMLNAVRLMKDWKEENTSVVRKGSRTFVYFNGSAIACYSHTLKKWRYSDALNTQKKRSNAVLNRLNALGANLYAERGLWYHAGTRNVFTNDFEEGEDGKIHVKYPSRKKHPIL